MEKTILITHQNRATLHFVSEKGPHLLSSIQTHLDTSTVLLEELSLLTSKLFLLLSSSPSLKEVIINKLKDPPFQPRFSIKDLDHFLEYFVFSPSFHLSPLSSSSVPTLAVLAQRRSLSPMFASTESVWKGINLVRNRSSSLQKEVGEKREGKEPKDSEKKGGGEEEEEGELRGGRKKEEKNKAPGEENRVNLPRGLRKKEVKNDGEEQEEQGLMELPRGSKGKGKKPISSGFRNQKKKGREKEEQDRKIRESTDGNEKRKLRKKKRDFKQNSQQEQQDRVSYSEIFRKLANSGSRQIDQPGEGGRTGSQEKGEKKGEKKGEGKHEKKEKKKAEDKREKKKEKGEGKEKENSEEKKAKKKARGSGSEFRTISSPFLPSIMSSSPRKKDGPQKLKKPAPFERTSTEIEHSSSSASARHSVINPSTSGLFSGTQKAPMSSFSQLKNDLRKAPRPKTMVIEGGFDRKKPSQNRNINFVFLAPYRNASVDFLPPSSASTSSLPTTPSPNMDQATQKNISLPRSPRSSHSPRSPRSRSPRSRSPRSPRSPRSLALLVPLVLLLPPFLTFLPLLTLTLTLTLRLAPPLLQVPFIHLLPPLLPPLYLLPVTQDLLLHFPLFPSFV